MQAQMKTIKLTFSRHGETQHNKSRLLAGQQNGKLTKLGRQQANKIGIYFHQQKSHFDFIYVSDLGRTKQTFKGILQKAQHLQKTPVEYSQIIREKSAGILENKPLQTWSINAKKEGKGIRQYKCQNGESWLDVMERARQFLKIVVRKHIIEANKDDQQKSGRILAVTHGGYIMQFHSVSKMINKKPINFDNKAKNCSIHQFQIAYPRNLQTYSQENVKIKCTLDNFVGHL